MHRILHRLIRTSFKNEFAFKGGTCLTKCYFGYYRFSEDLDFTYIKQEEFAGKSQNEIRKILSAKTNYLLDSFLKIAKDLGLNFSNDKSDSRYVELGGSNKLATFKLWYRSGILKRQQFVKVQITFVELVEDEIIENTAKSLYSSIPAREMKLLYPAYEDIIEDVKLKSYSLTEILLEKIRAILTRRGLKARDFIDVYLINKKLKLDFSNEEERIIAKIRFALRYDKYVQNLSVLKLEDIVLGDEEKLLLRPLDKGFKKFLPKFSLYVKRLQQELQNTPLRN